MEIRSDSLRNGKCELIPLGLNILGPMHKKDTVPV